MTCSFVLPNAHAPERLLRRRVDPAMALSAKQASAKAGKGDNVIGWKIDQEEQRNDLLQQFPPRYINVVADHITLAAKVAKDAALPCETVAEIVGRADDGEGVEAMVVRLGGTTDRPDGSTYHITWSLGPDRRAKESNDVIRGHGWQPLDLAVPIQLQPARF